MIGGSQRSMKPYKRSLVGSLGSLLMVAFGTALVVGSGFGVYLALQYVPRTQPVETKAVVVIDREVGARLPIPPGALRLAQAPPGLVPASALTNVGDAAGKVAAERLMPGEMVLRHRIMEPGADGGLSSFLQPEEVAVTFPAAGIGGVGGVLPGDRVDVLVTLRAGTTVQAPAAGAPLAAVQGQPAAGPFTTVALQNLRVLSVSKSAGTARQGSVASRAGALVSPVGALAEGSGQVVFAANYRDALFLKALKDADNVTLDLVLRPMENPELAPGDGLTLPDGFQQRRITVP